MENKLILQSYKLTEIRNDFGIYAQRLILRIAERMQYRLEDIDFTKPVVKPSDQRLYWNFKISEINTEGNTNYQQVKEELRKVIKAGVHMEFENGWRESVVFTDIEAEDNGNGNLKVKINDSVWDLFIEFSKGFKKYSLQTALSLRTTYALRLYQLLANNEQPITYTIDWLRELFGLKDKYTDTNMFIRRVIQPAQAELDEKAEKSFCYKPIYSRPQGKGRKKISAIEFITIPIAQNTNPEIVLKENNRKYGVGTIPREIRDKLMQTYNFSEHGIKANAHIIFDAYAKMKNPTLIEFLSEKLAKAQKAKNPQGWIINALKSELETL